MIVYRKVGDKYYAVRVEGVMEEADAIRLGNKEIDRKIAADALKPAMDAWKTEWDEKKLLVEKLKLEAMEHYRVVTPLQQQAILKEFNMESVVIAAGQLDVLSFINPAVVSIVHDVRSKLDYNILKAYWNAELDWANMRYTYPQAK